MKQDSDEIMKKDPAKTPQNISNLTIRNKSQSRRDSVDLKKKKKTPANQPSTTGPIKKALRHWRSPSNPVDWSKSAWSVNSSLIGADEKEASQPTLNRNNSSNSNMRMTNTYPEQSSDILSVIGSPPVPTLNIQNTAVSLKAYYLPTPLHRRHRHPPSPLSTHSFTAQDLNTLLEEEELRIQERREKMTFIQDRSSTPIPRIKSPLIKVPVERRSHSWRQSYELTLMKCPSLASHGQGKFPLLAEMTVSPIVSAVSSDFSSTRRFAFAFEATYCGQLEDFDGFAATSLGFGRIDPLCSDLIFARNAQRFANRANLSLTSASQAAQKLAFSRSSLLQVILRNPQDGAVADIFVLRLDLSDMPANSRTILRQKVYRTPGAEREDSELKSIPGGNQSSYLAKEIEIPLIRTYDAESKRQRIKLSGPITVAFSFNRSNLRFPGKANASGVERAQKTTTLLQFPVEKKYFSLQTLPTSLDSLKRTSSLNSSDRSSQHGSLCL